MKITYGDMIIGSQTLRSLIANRNRGPHSRKMARVGLLRAKSRRMLHRLLSGG